MSYSFFQPNHSIVVSLEESFDGRIPCCLQYSSNDPKYPSPLLVQIYFSFLPISFPTKAWNCLNISNTWSLCLNVYAKIFLKWSSINVMNYSKPPSVFTFIGPYKSEWTELSKFSFLKEKWCVLKATLFCFLAKQWEHFCRYVFVIPNKCFFHDNAIIVYLCKYSLEMTIILLFYVDDMSIVGKNAFRIDRLKKQLSESFAMKDLRPTKQILSMRIKQHGSYMLTKPFIRERIEVCCLITGLVSPLHMIGNEEICWVGLGFPFMWTMT